MTDTLWLKPKDGDGPLALVVDEQGHLILCDECPCTDRDCVEVVGERVAAMLGETDPDTHQPIWQVYDTHTSDFQCATWLHDVELDTWTLSHQATGSLLIALRVGLNVADTAESTATLLTYAQVLQNLQTGKKRVVGCECRVRNYECSPRVVVLDDFDVAGSLPVWSPGEGDTYTQYDSCRVDTCALLKFKLQTAQYWHGGTMMGEGYYDWLLTPQQWEPANYRYQPFLQAIKWQFSTTTYAVTYINCDCTSISTHNLAAGETCLEYAGICTLEDPCIALMLLHNKAEQNGWTWHDEGVLVRKAQASRQCYLFNSRILVLACADTGDSLIYVSCGCSLSTIETSSYALYTYLEYPGCACFDVRELLLAYPDVFGVVDVSFGDDTVYTVDYMYEYEDMDTGTTVQTRSVNTYSCLQSSHGYDAYFCDYRSMFVIFDNTCVGISPSYNDTYPDMIMYKFDTNGNIDYNGWYANGSGYVSVTNGSIVFDGHVPPFTTSEMNRTTWPHASLGMEWQGLTIRWTAQNSHAVGPDGPYAGYSSETDANNALAYYNNLPNPYGQDEFYAYTSNWRVFIPPHVSMGPSYSYTAVPGVVMPPHAQGNPYPDMYTVRIPYHDWGDGIVYNINFVITNKGFLKNGESGYSDTLAVYGFTDTIPHWTVPPTEAYLIQRQENDSENPPTRCTNWDPSNFYDGPCPEGTVYRLSYGASIESVPMYDMSFLAELREAMGGCQDDWWDIIMNQED